MPIICKNTLLLTKLVTLLALSGFATSFHADAQDSPRPRAGALEEIVVTAQRREESIRDVPIAMQAFTAETLKQLGVVDTRDLANLIPGFTFADSAFDNPIYTLRGVGFDDYSRTANSTVGVYVDEVPLAYPYMTQGADVDLARIEVLKGPQGTLYGRNTTGGAINYIANKPTEALELGIEAEYGRFETLSLEGYVSGAITDRLRGRIALRHIESGEGWQKSLTRPRDRLGEMDKQAGRLTLDWDPIDTLQLNFTLDWWRDRSEPQAPQAISISHQSQQFRDIDSLFNQLGLEMNADSLHHPDVRDHPLVETDDNRLADWAPEFPWTLNNEFFMPALRAYWDVTQRTSLALLAAYSEFETDRSALPLSGLSVINAEIVERSSSTESYSAELRAEGDLMDEQLQWILGLFRSQDSVRDDQLFNAERSSALYNVQPGVILITDLVLTGGEQDARSNAVFANLDYALSHYLAVTVGARYTDEVRRLAACSREAPGHQGVGFTPLFNARSLSEGGSGGGEPGDCFVLHEETRNPSLIRKKLEENNLGGRAALTWTPADGLLFYLSYSRGFKSGSFPILPNSEGVQYDPVTQERLDSIEFGGKTSWFADRLRADFAVFNYDYTDKQLFSYFIDPVFGPLQKLFNVPETRIRGAELEVQSNPLSGLFISAAAAYIDTEIKRFVGINSFGDTVDFSGRELPFAPKRSLTLLANYSFPLPFLAGLEGIVGVDYSYVSSATSEIEEDPIFDLPSYELVNARVGIGDIDGRWDVTAWMRNATDEFYQRSVPNVLTDTNVRFTGMPRTYGVTLAYRYF